MFLGDCQRRDFSQALLFWILFLSRKLFEKVQCSYEEVLQLTGLISLSQRFDFAWSSLTVLQELYGAVEDRLYDDVKLVGEDVDKCLD